MVAAALKDEQVCDVTAEAKDRCEQHDLAIYLLWIENSLYCLSKEPNQETPDNDDTAEGANYISSVVAIGVLQRGRLACQADRHEGDGKACNI